MRTIKIKDNQTLIDIAIQEYGTAESLVYLAFENNISITAELVPGTELKIPDAPVNLKTLKYYQYNEIIPATAQLSPDIEALVALDDVDDTVDPAPVFSREYTLEYKSEFGTQI